MIEAEEQNCHISDLEKANLVYGLPDEGFNLAKCIMEASKQAENSGFLANDIHANNIGKRNDGEFVLYDQSTGLTDKQIESEFQIIKSRIINKDINLNWANENNAERPHNFNSGDFVLLQVNIKDLFEKNE